MSKQTLGGSFMIYDAVKQDFPVEAVLDMYLDLCDVVAVLDCGPGDAHKDLLAKYKGKIIVKKGDWYQYPNIHRFEHLPRQIIFELGTAWHLHLQADEILHEDAHGLVRELIEDNRWDGYLMRRLNLWTSYDKVIRFDAPKKPIDDISLRLARKFTSPTMDLTRDNDLLCITRRICWDFIDRLPIFHYGLVTDWRVRAQKVLRNLEENFGRPSDRDQRLVRSLEEGRYRYEDFPWTSWIKDLEMEHPKYVKKWMDNPDRRMVDHDR